jgi:RHS repeat-associated protein
MKRTLIAITLALSFIAAAQAGNAGTWTAQPNAAGSGTWDSGDYIYDALGNIINVGTDAYAYDSAQRLVTGTADVQRTGLLNEQHYSYDSFGNRIAAVRASGSKPCVNNTPCELAVTVDPLTNHINSDGASYDAAGNLIAYGPAHYVYDPLSMIVRETEGANDFQFVYGANDERIAVDKAGAWTWSLRDGGNQVIREFTSNDVAGGGTPGAQTREWSEDYVSRDGPIVASVSRFGATSSTTHAHVDHLGTPRLLTDSTGTLVALHSYYPYGAELEIAPRENPQDNRKFAGNERDITGDAYALDYIHARQYSSAAGRFITMDKGPYSTAPLSWNRYTYARNSPLRLVDRDGFCVDDSFAKNLYYTVMTDPYVQVGLNNIPAYWAYSDPELDARLDMIERDQGWLWGQQSFKDFVYGMGGAAIAGLLEQPGIAKATAKHAASRIWRQILLHPDSAVIGENMDRVNEAAEEIGTWSGAPKTVTAVGENAQWLKDRICHGDTIFDIGTDPSRTTRSVYYGSESRMLGAKGSGYERHFFGLILVNNQPTSVYVWTPKLK